MDVQAGILSFKALAELAQSLIEVSTSARGKQAVVDLIGQLGAARQTYLSLADEAETAKKRIASLEAEVQELKDWSAERERYKLQEIGTGAVAYTIKAGEEGGEPPHWLCPNCFARRQKSFLLYQGQDRTPTNQRSDLTTYNCAVCKTVVRVHFTKKPGAA